MDWSMNYIASKVSALMGTVSLAASVAALVENQSVLFVSGVALGILFFLYAAYRFPNDQALQENGHLRQRIGELETALTDLKVRNERAIIHAASLEQRLQDAGMKIVAAMETKQG